MNVRVFLTLAALINPFNGFWYFLAPDDVASVHGFAASVQLTHSGFVQN